jgi:hypothetical protein
LSGSADHAELILSFIESRSRHVRECAFKALSGIRSGDVVTRVCIQFRKGVREAAWAMRNTRDLVYASVVTEVLSQTLQNRDGIFALTQIESERLFDCWRACWGQDDDQLDNAVLAWLRFSSEGGFKHRVLIPSRTISLQTLCSRSSRCRVCADARSSLLRCDPGSGAGKECTP